MSIRPVSALYQQIQDHVLAHIQSGAWPVGHKLPSENDMVRQFGVSRMTVNRALREMGTQGHIERVAGVGSFVAPSKVQSNLVQIAQLGAEVHQRGHAYRFDLISQARVAASLEVAMALDLDMGESVFHVICVHFEDELPVQLEDRYINPRMAPQALSQDFSLIPPSEYMVRNVRYDQMEHVVDAVLPTPVQARLLQMDASDPCLQLTRRTWLRDKPITWVRCLHPGNRYRLGSRFHTERGNTTA
jgi:GntR family histidine utilization transcriptional repressor